MWKMDNYEVFYKGSKPTAKRENSDFSLVEMINKCFSDVIENVWTRIR